MLIKSTAVAAFLALTATAQAQSRTSDESSTNSSPQSQTQREYDDSRGMGGSRSGGGQMSGSGRHSESGDSMQHMELTGDADRDFAIRMKLHHQQGLEMAKAHLKDAKSPQLKSMAKKMIAAQKKEIAQFDKWLDSQR